MDEEGAGEGKQKEAQGYIVVGAHKMVNAVVTRASYLISRNDLHMKRELRDRSDSRSWTRLPTASSATLTRTTTSDTMPNENTEPIPVPPPAVAAPTDAPAPSAPAPAEPTPAPVEAAPEAPTPKPEPEATPEPEPEPDATFTLLDSCGESRSKPNSSKERLKDC